MEFYRYWTQIDQDGLVLRCTTYIPIYESPAYYWCVPINREFQARASIERGTGVTAAMRRNKGKRVSKRGRRPQICKTREQALEYFKARKQAHFNHASRSREEARVILRALDDSRVENWPAARTPGVKHIPGTRPFVHEHYDFDY